MSAFTNLYDNGEWGYMGIGPMPAYPIAMTITASEEYSYFTCGAGDNWSILAYVPTDKTKYAVLKNTTLGTIYVAGNEYNPSYRIVTNNPVNDPDIPASVTVNIPTDPDAWNFYGGLTSVEGCALCMWVPSTSGSAPNGTDYVSIGQSYKSLFSYEDDREEFACTIDGNYIYAKRAERDANGNVISSVPASTSADEDKVLTVDSNGDAVWATPSVDEVPDVTSSDDGKVLTASYSGGTGSYAWATPATPIVDEVPTVTSSDNGKVLKATYSGGQGSYAWDTVPGGTSYTAGTMISISNQNAISVSTTAGITDIQQVSVLPANPVSTVLYLIPET